MNINDYVLKFKNKTFDKMPFNDVDSLILSQLSYVNFDMVTSSIDEDKEPVAFKDIIIEDKKAFYLGSVDSKNNEAMFDLMQKSKRFKDIKVGHYLRQFSKNNIIQFFSITFILPDDTLYIAFRGTDTTVVGWKEDFLLAFEPTMPSHKLAVQYTNKIIKKYEKNKFYLGGHSKGGNIAFYVTCHLSEKQSERLIKAFSYDGPGFKDGITKFPRYLSVRHRLTKFLTYNDVIGSVFNNMKRYKVVHSPGVLFGGHDPFYWKVIAKNNDFWYAKDVSKGSKKYSRRVMKWLESLTILDRKLAADALFDVFANNNTIYDLFRNFLKNLISIKKSLAKYSPEEREKLKAIIKRLMGFLLNSSKVKDIKKKQAILDRELKPKRKK